MRDDLTVGVAFETMAVGDELGVQSVRVLNDTIVGDGHRSEGMGVRIALGGLAMGRPAGVRDARVSGQRLVAQHRLQRGDPASDAPTLDPGLANHRNAG